MTGDWLAGWIETGCTNLKWSLVSAGNTMSFFPVNPAAAVDYGVAAFRDERGSRLRRKNITLAGRSARRRMK
jgi:hypothetical protein